MDSKQADYNENSNNEEDQKIIEDLNLNLVSESGDSESGTEELYIMKQNSLMVDDSQKKATNQTNKTSTNQNIHGYSDSGVVYNIKGSSSDVLQGRS